MEYIDEVMYDFPELVFVTRHGCEPWEDLAVKLMLKWPGLHYSHQRVRAEALPEGDHRLRQHARRRQDHLRGLLPDGAHARAHHGRHADVPFHDHVWPKFLRENAERVLKLT